MDNIAKLEAVILEIGGNSDIAVQPSSIGAYHLWTVTRRTHEGFWIGQGKSLASAIADLTLSNQPRTNKPDLDKINALAA